LLHQFDQDQEDYRPAQAKIIEMGQGIMKDLHPSLVSHGTSQPTQFVLFAEGSA
jgi:hypothetical protein